MMLSPLRGLLLLCVVLLGWSAHETEGNGTLLKEQYSVALTKSAVPAHASLADFEFGLWGLEMRDDFDCVDCCPNTNASSDWVAAVFDDDDAAACNELGCFVEFVKVSAKDMVQAWSVLLVNKCASFGATFESILCNLRSVVEGYKVTTSVSSEDLQLARSLTAIVAVLCATWMVLLALKGGHAFVTRAALMSLLPLAIAGYYLDAPQEMHEVLWSGVIMARDYSESHATSAICVATIVIFGAGFAFARFISHLLAADVCAGLLEEGDSDEDDVQETAVLQAQSPGATGHSSSGWIPTYLTSPPTGLTALMAAMNPLPTGVAPVEKDELAMNYNTFGLNALPSQACPPFDAPSALLVLHESVGGSEQSIVEQEARALPKEEPSEYKLTNVQNVLGIALPGATLPITAKLEEDRVPQIDMAEEVNSSLKRPASSDEHGGVSKRAKTET